MKSNKKQKIIIGNWKMNPATPAEAKKLFTTFLKQKYQSKNVTTVVCPPFIYLDQLRQAYSGSKVFLGAQDCYVGDTGSHTGQISPKMLQNMKCNFVILGHSERRAIGETNEYIATKVKAALQAGMHVVLCLGELERNDDGLHLKYIEQQITESLKGVNRTLVKNVVIAYEPVWAIGKGKKAMDPHSIYQMVLFIKKVLMGVYGKKAGSDISIIYGGSSNASNAAAIVTEGMVDGLLPGRASLDPKEFSGMIEAVSKAL